MLSWAGAARRRVVRNLTITSNGRMFRQRLAGLKSVKELVNHAQITASSVRVTELEREPEPAGVRMLQVQNREQSPSVFIFASCRPIFTVRKQDVNEPLLGHARPVERKAPANYFPWRFRKGIEQISGNDAKVAAARSPTGAKKIWVLPLVHTTCRRLTTGINRNDVYGGNPVNREAMQPGKQTISSPADVPSS